ncbi:hypothetical protein TcWFU_005183 [Taenia crassiceps]|uniref:Uncharacterized protein n=1 Tax=Taenia crassiceps TaxID=6207 RepID=A0ABR4QB40_9CEST
MPIICIFRLDDTRNWGFARHHLRANVNEVRFSKIQLIRRLNVFSGGKHSPPDYLPNEADFQVMMLHFKQTVSQLCLPPSREARFCSSYLLTAVRERHHEGVSKS